MLEKSLLGKKRLDKNSNEKEVYLYDCFEENENLKEKKKVESIEELKSYLSNLKNPFTIIDGSYTDLNIEENCKNFFTNKKFNKIYQKDDNSKLFEDYREYYYLYENVNSGSIKLKYPMLLNKLLLGPKFFFDLPDINCPKFYRPDDSLFPHLNGFFVCRDYNLFHIYMRKGSGTTLYLMKQMERTHECFIYIDLRKLNEILFIKIKNRKEFKEQLKKFIFYSIFNIQTIYSDSNLKEAFQNIEDYYYYILSIIGMNISVKNSNEFIKILLDSYIELYKKFIHQRLLDEKIERYKMLIIIIDHYNQEIEINYIKDLLKKNDDSLKFLIKHSLNNKNEINNFFQYIDDKSFKQGGDFISFLKGIEVDKNKEVIGYYEEMYPLDKTNFDDNNLKIFKLYENEILENFSLSEPIYFYKFLDYMKSKNQNNKDLTIFEKFLKISSKEIELNIRKFYNNNLENEYFFISKYFSINFSNQNKEDKDNINLIKNNIPLDYFIIKFSKKNKDILDIIPSCNLVKKILLTKSKNFSIIIYQSKYYQDKLNQSEKGEILQKAIEEKIRNDPSTLLNFAENTLILEIEYLIPSAKNINSKIKDPVIEYHNTIIDKKKKDKQNILFYMSDIEKKDMEKLKAIKEKSFYKNIILIQKDAHAKNYDLGIIKFIDNNSFVLLLFQITVSREEKKFAGVNKCFEFDISYLVAKFEEYLIGYKSKGVFLIYVLDVNEDIYFKKDIEQVNEKNDEINIKDLNPKSKSKSNTNKKNINYKNHLNSIFNDKVYLLFFGRKYLNFFTEEGKMVKELDFIDEKINFISYDKYYYFIDEYLQKAFEKIITLFSIEIGKVFIDDYDYEDMIGNFLIISKINNTFSIIVINIDGKKLHCIELNDGTLKQVSSEMNYIQKKSYFFEIINPTKINKITLFSNIQI